jgi:hypothetical protein
MLNVGAGDAGHGTSSRSLRLKDHESFKILTSFRLSSFYRSLLSWSLRFQAASRIAGLVIVFFP